MTYPHHPPPISPPPPSPPISRQTRPFITTRPTSAPRGPRATTPAAAPAAPAAVPGASSTLVAPGPPKPKRRRRPTAALPARLKGLKNFAVAVAAMVEDRQVTTYAEVADQLVAQIIKALDEETAWAAAPASAAGPAEARAAPAGAAGVGSEAGEDAGGASAAAPGLQAGERAQGAAAAAPGAPGPGRLGRAYEEKNIRRRVYDALNVMYAIGVISKEKKRITWKGRRSLLGLRRNCMARGPGGGGGAAATAQVDVREVRAEMKRRRATVAKKQERVATLRQQAGAMENLVDRNRGAAEGGGGGAACGRAGAHGTAAEVAGAGDDSLPLLLSQEWALVARDASLVTLPFLLLSCAADTKINLHMRDDHQHCEFDFSAKCQYWDGYDLVHKMGIRSRSAVLEDLNTYVVPPAS